MTTHLAWYIARGAGLVAWALAAATVIWGLSLSTRALGRRPAPRWLADLHQYLGGLTVVFTAIHVIALLADTYVQFDITDVLVPFASRWHPVAVAWGIVSFYLLLAVQITSLLRRRIPARLWRRVHLASFVLFAGATVHLLTAGTDAGTGWVRWTVAGVTVGVVYLTIVRVLQPTRGRRAPRGARADRGARQARPVERAGAPGRRRDLDHAS